MKASIIIPAYNEEENIQECVKSLLNNTYINKEIIVVNDGSTDNTCNILSQFNSIIVINLQKNGMLSAINEGVKRSSGEIVLKIDADSFAPRLWVSEMIEHFNNPEVLLVGGTIRNKLNTRLVSIGLKTLDEIYFNILNRKLSVCKIMGANWAVRSYLLKDEKQFTNKVTDESILLSIIKSKKGKTVFDTNIHIIINSPISFVRLWERKYVWGTRAIKDKMYVNIKFWIRPLYFILLIITMFIFNTSLGKILFGIVTLPLFILMFLSMNINLKSLIITPIVFLISEFAFVFGSFTALIKNINNNYGNNIP